MPGLARKVLICAAVDGLVLHPLNSRKDQPPQSQQQRSPPAPAPIRIRYGDAAISTLPRDSAAAVPDAAAPSFEAYGIVGLITVFRHAYLVSITRRQQVALLPSSVPGAPPQPIYVISEVALTPCASRSEAVDFVARTAATLSSSSGSKEDDGEGSSEEEGSGSGQEVVRGDEVMSEGEEVQVGRGGGGVVKDVVEKRGSYGRFAQRWFSRSGWAMDQKRTMGLSGGVAAAGDGEGNGRKGGVVVGRGVTEEGGEGSEAAESLLPKLLRTSQILFGASKTFYFAYDYDLTRSLANTPREVPTGASLHEVVDKNYFWNRHMLAAFIDAGADSLVLPLMQGFVGQRGFVVDSHPPQVDEGGAHKESVELSDFVLSRAASPQPEGAAVAGSETTRRPTERKYNITIISRRSVKRAGLRYLRRGIDEDGNVANSVESEQLLSPADPTPYDPATPPRIYSFVQTRGSIPLFFTQSPYSLKPVPELRHSAEANLAALRRHFGALRARYGAVQAVNLVEKHGVEAEIGEMYEGRVKKLNQEEDDNGESKGEVAFEWFDFHAVCRGMKFENVSLLLQTLGGQLDEFGSSVAAGGTLVARQKGVLRTNCMDCLDRTNVCQSSFAKHMLDLQLKEEGFDMAVQLDQENAWFNTLWADNGDAISKQYASTGAMKGDYTRTRKRNYRGALTDAGLSLTRLFNGMFNDFFLQASIDFLLGNVTSLVFEEFEATMMTKDPAVSMQNMRQQAIELCQKRVVADEAEEFIGGWALLTPSAPDTVRSASFDEAVLLLTDVALYLCRFDWNLDKVSSFERVDLAHVSKIRFGTYITSTISPAQTDDMRNFGLVVEYKPGLTDITRVNTRSLSSMSSTAGKTPVPSGLASEETPAPPPSSGLASFLSRKPPPPPPRKIALKALHSQTSAADPTDRNNNKQDDGGAGAVTRLTEIQQVVLIAAEIERLAIQNQPRAAGKSPEAAHLIEKGDIISLAEARRNTTIFEQWGHSIMKLVWA
ncbi:Phosphatidylinositide phosphatase SAC2 [Staphylotrichum tortipilum]|uniref:Phosphatidylinositide phosphatase SAC2 n=1 Tax=Staphylotrichum tortipilum TaxID=2831512 RepID=A0AAN6RUD1_9PEZI|nr:Phosphatidylinositide phosphatase SAC2 [Staphylotrichum longicolle]